MTKSEAGFRWGFGIRRGIVAGFFLILFASYASSQTTLETLLSRDFERQWQTNPIACVEALRQLGLDDEPAALERLERGQSRAVRETYEAAYAKVDERPAMWSLFLALSPVGPAVERSQKLANKRYEEETKAAEKAYQDALRKANSAHDSALASRTKALSDASDERNTALSDPRAALCNLAGLAHRLASQAQTDRGSVESANLYLASEKDLDNPKPDNLVQLRAQAMGELFYPERTRPAVLAQYRACYAYNFGEFESAIQTAVALK